MSTRQVWSFFWSSESDRSSFTPGCTPHLCRTLWKFSCEQKWTLGWHETPGRCQRKRSFQKGLSNLSRRDDRTQPGVLTPDTDKKKVCPEGGGRTEATKAHPRSKISYAPSASPTRYAGAIPTRRSTPTLHYSITPRGRIRGRGRRRVRERSAPFGARRDMRVFLGLKLQAQSYRPFGIKSDNPRGTI
jgi:hypothetical protein